MYFNTKSYLKSNHYHTTKHTLNHHQLHRAWEGAGTPYCGCISNILTFKIFFI
jgi:hypothetical protein